MREVIEQLAIARTQLESKLQPRIRKYHAEAWASFQRLRGNRRFFEGFYGRFLPKLDDKVRKRFPMDMDMQYRMLREALELLLLNPVEPDNPALKNLAEVHGRPGGFGLNANDYDQFMNCLTATVETHEGGQLGKQIAAAWQKALAPGMAYMKLHIGSEPADATSEPDDQPGTLEASANRTVKLPSSGRSRPVRPTARFNGRGQPVASRATGVHGECRAQQLNGAN